MALDKLVDSTQLDTDLTSVANAIRTKGGTSAQLAFPADFVSAIADIPSGGGGITTGSVTPASASNSLDITIGSGKTGFVIWNTVGANSTPKAWFNFGIKDTVLATMWSNNAGTSGAYPTFAIGTTVASNSTVRFDTPSDGTVRVTTISSRNFIEEEYKWMAW